MENTSDNGSTVLEASGISKQVSSPEGHLTILSEVSFAIARGESVAVVGPSGAGKSTLLALLAGLDLPTSGHVNLNGHNLGKLDEDGRARVRAESVGFVFQSFHLVPSLNALENVMLPLELAGKDDARAASQGIIEQVGLAERWSHYPAQLSGGEKQRVAIARAFAMEPAVLFLLAARIQFLPLFQRSPSYSTIQWTLFVSPLSGRFQKVQTMRSPSWPC